MSKIPKIPDIPEEERTPLVVHLLEVMRYQSELIQRLRDEIAILKGDKPRPKIKPNGMEKGEKKNNDSSDGKRPGSSKRSKTKELKIHEVIPISPENIPEGSIFKGYKECVVQGIIIQPHNILYRLQRWKRPDGSYIEGELPSYVQGHFDPSLISYIQYQYFQCHTTQPLLLEQLREFGIDISSGQISRILIEAHANFHAERTIHKIVPYTDEQRQALKSTRDKIWKLYDDLKAYKENPTEENKAKLENRFDNIFLEKSCFGTLEFALKRLHKNKAGLLLVLDRPEIPLHNNVSESDIREYVKRRKVSGGIQSPSGRKSRDTFTSLKKTCRKLKVSFWEYLIDRNYKQNAIPRLSELMRKMAFAPP